MRSLALDNDRGTEQLAGGGHAQFRRRRALEESPRQRDMTARAVRRAQLGDREALRYLYVEYADNVFGYVSSIVRDEHEAEDITQHVFAKLMLVLPKYEQRQSPFLAWILRVARNVAVDHLRRRRMLPCEDVRGCETESPEMHQHEVLSVRQALAALPAEQREVVVLRHVVGLTPGEIAHQMGKTESSIHGLHHRGRAALRAALSELELAPATAA